MFRKLIFLTSFVLVLGLVSINVTLGDVLEIPVAAASDDAEEGVWEGSEGVMEGFTSTDLELPYEGALSDNEPQVVGVRFVDVQIPKGSTIISAYVQFDADDINNDYHIPEVHLLIDGELSPNPVTFDDTPYNITSRPRTAAVVEWDPAQWMETHLRSADEATSDISSIIQEIVNQDGWAGGNALVLFFRDNPANPSAGIREAESFDGAGDNVERRPTLHVEFEAGAAPAGGQGVDGMVLIEYWNNIGGTALSDLYGNANYPDNPDEQDILTLLDRPYDRPAPNNDNYGARIRGYLLPPETGDYNFWIASDDASEFLLSTDEDPANVVRIAWIDGWCNAYDWDNTGGSDNPNQASAAPVTLEAGKKYYIEIGLKEGGGGDGVAVAWQGPGIADRAVIAGDYLSSVALPASVLTASNPNPADGAVDADTTSLEWTAGPTAVSHKVYFSADDTIDESELAAETEFALAAPAMEPGMTYYWRVDEVDADGNVFEGALWSFSTLPLEAHFPNPEDGATGIESGATLSWTAGKGVIMHDVYFGTDEAAVAAADMTTFKGKVMDASFDPGPLELFTTYYWRIDEFSVTGINAGPVWSFSTPEYVVIDSGETTLDYDNSAEPYVSEAAWDTPADLTFGGVSVLSLRFHGGTGPEGSVSLDEATGTYSITGSGADVWGSSDQFHYGYRELTGDGEIVARVVDNGTGSNNWAKGGVMIRETLDANSKHMIAALTGSEGGGIAFQGRPETGGNSMSYHGDITASPPYWVKLTREGNTITAYCSADGVEWTLFTDTSPDGAITNPIDVEMADPVLIGLFVTSHQAGELRTYTFDNVSIAGSISDTDMSTDIGIPFNTPEPVYVALEDATGAVATIAHPYAEATMIDAWRDWTIPLSEFAGVDPANAAKFYFGVGDGEPGGHGSVQIADIRVVHPDMTAAIASWEAAAASAAPGFIATNIADGLYDIGAFSGDITYEFAVRSNPDETEASMCLIGRRQFGDTQAGLKYEQWNNTGTYGATLFGVVDLDFGIATNPGVDTHLVFVSSEDAGTTALYVDGVYQASVDSAITLFGNVGIGYGAQGADGSDFFDNFDGDIFGVAIYDAALSDEEIAAHSDAFFAPVSDVTVSSDIVKGIPDDGDWPGGEHPALAIDDNTGTKYLHFKGDFEPDPGTGGSGIKITPLDGPSNVTGLSFTTANDVPGRDPIAFELSGSNVGIDGPYTLIASGDIVDFAGEAEWPRFTKNETAITFDNPKIYSHYQIIFTAIRGPVGGSVNSMQIAEVELLGVPAADAPTIADIAWVSYHGADDEPHADAAAVGFTKAPDIEYTDLLKVNGYNVVRVLTSQTPDVEFLNTMDLVIISRTASSGHYSGSGATLWNSVTAPMINLNGYTLRSSRLGFTDGTDMPDTTGDIRLTVTDPTHPIFAGIALTDGVMDNLYAEGAVPLPTDGTISRGISINNNNIDDEGTVLATVAEVSADTGPVGGMIIAEWPAGATMENSSGSPTDVLGGPRLVFLTGSREPSGVTGGQAAALYDLYPDGERMFLNAVAYMINPPEPVEAVNLLANGGFEDGVPDPWSTYGDATLEVVQELAGAAVPEAPIEGGSCLHVVVGSAGANFWDAGLQHAGHVFEAGKSYTLSAYLKAKEGTMNINFKPELGADPWTGYGSQEYTMTDTWAEYTVNTGVIDANVDPATITFHIAYAPGEFWVDDVRFTED
jgi:hypothetical protein